MKGFVSYILDLCRKKEGTEVEFKSALGGFPGSFWETYSAFANTKGGVIVLGVKEKNHHFTPDGFTDEQVDKYKKTFWDCANNKGRYRNQIPIVEIWLQGRHYKMSRLGVQLESSSIILFAVQKKSRYICRKGRQIRNLRSSVY